MMLTRRTFLRTSVAAIGAAAALPHSMEGASGLAGSAAAGTPRFGVGYQIFGWSRYFPSAWWRGARAVGALGYRAIEGEYTIAELYQGREGEFERRMAECGVRVNAFYSSTDLDRRHQHAENVRKNLQTAAFAARLGAKVIVMGGTEATSRTAEDFASFARAANEIGQHAFEVHGVKCGYHPHLGALVESREDIARVMDATDPRYFFLAPDTGHLAAAGCDVVEVFQTYRTRVIHAHLKDYRPAATPGARGSFLPLGEGVVDFARLREVLVASGFDGWVNVELDGGRGIDPADVAKRARGYVTDTLGLSLTRPAEAESGAPEQERP
jgi:sugar phosphate isomerase/epimerase